MRMNAKLRQAIDVDRETTALVAQLLTEAPEDRGVAGAVTVERLRRLEEEARCSGTSRQAFQRITSARRLLGDQVHFGPFKGPFLND